MFYMLYNKGAQSIVFDDFAPMETEGSYWVNMCPRCRDRYFKYLKNKVDDCVPAGLTCSVLGCFNEADFYVDFEPEEIKFVKAKQWMKDIQTSSI